MITDHGDNDAASADGDDDINGGVVMTIDSDCCDGMGGDGDDERCCRLVMKMTMKLMKRLMLMMMGVEYY